HVHGSLTPAIATILTPDERLRVDAAGQGLYRAVHRERVEELARDLKERPIHAIVVSVACCDDRAAARVGSLVREFPRVPAVALLTQLETRSASTVLALGRNGVRRLVDVRHADGWRELRSLLMADTGDDIGRLALAQIAVDLAAAREDCLRFFETLFAPSPAVTVRALARRLDLRASTLMSRFFRARLPAPKRYLSAARLVRAARLLENGGLSVANVADHLEYSSPQSFGRHVRAQLGLTATEFRARYDGEGMLHRFRQTLVLPHQEVLRRFSPIEPPRLARPPREKD
ncbi:MAG TPA: helix-turn-helix domain-containing protein, partial [Gemmatimonadaceae bacterium]|nr:helix-turn-helix domain-containing protein [Gemmatimonadaceae bacterium]